MAEYIHWCGNCQIRIYVQRHFGKTIDWVDCPYVCEYKSARRNSVYVQRGEPMRLIDADALEREGWSLSRTFQKDECTMVYEVKKPSDFPTIEERKEEIRKSWAIKELPSCSKMEQVEDCISRQAAIDALENTKEVAK